MLHSMVGGGGEDVTQCTCRLAVEPPVTAVEHFRFVGPLACERTTTR